MPALEGATDIADIRTMLRGWVESFAGQPMEDVRTSPIQCPLRLSHTHSSLSLSSFQICCSLPESVRFHSMIARSSPPNMHGPAPARTTWAKC